MTTPTGYLVNTGTASNPVYKDLINIFQPLGSGTYIPKNNTGFQTSSGQDLAAIFAPLRGGTPLSYNTNLYALSGQDLKNIFLRSTPSVAIKVPSGYYYSYVTSDGYTVVIFANYTSQTTTPPASPTTNIANNTVTGINVVFTNFVNNPVYITVVGGGGGGGAGYNYSGFYAGGGGGSGGGIYSTSLTPTNQTYNIQVGGAGAAGMVGTNSFMNSTDSSLKAVGAGGNMGGTAYVSGGSFPGTTKTLVSGSGGAAVKGTITSGSGGKGGMISSTGTKNTNGISGSNPASSCLIYPSTSYNFGGGGGGGYSTTAFIPLGGLGGGGSSNAGTNGNAGQSYNGPSSIYYNVGGVIRNNFPGVGGGGAGADANATAQVGGSGGSGVVILCYQTVNP